MTAIIDDVAFVINSGKSTIESYTVHDNMTHLEEKWISKINMKQRKDLCGYFKPGSCFHLCTKVIKYYLKTIYNEFKIHNLRSIFKIYIL